MLREGDAVFLSIDGQVLKLRIDSLDLSPSGNRLLRGGIGGTRLLLVSDRDGVWRGRVSHEGQNYQVSGNINDLSVALETEERRHADEPMHTFQGLPVALKELQARAVAPQADPSNLSPVVLDVLIIREPEVDPAYIDLSVLFANDAFFTSKAPIQLRILAEEVVPDMRGTLGEILERAYFGEAEFDLPLPMAFGADVAAVFVDTQEDEEFCGIANYGLYQEDGQIFIDPWLYSVTDVNCPIDVFAHEVGHNLGAAHDRENVEDESLVVFPFAYGHRSGLYGTIMSYAPFIDPYYSNPEIIDCGLGSDEACGVPEDGDEPSDVARLVRLVAPVTTLLGDPFAQGAHSHVMPGSICKPRFPQGDNSVEWREMGIVHRGTSNTDAGETVELVCPLKRRLEEDLDDDSLARESFFVSVTLGDTIEPGVPYDCSLTENIGGDIAYEFSTSVVLGTEPDEPYTIVFPRVTPQDRELSTYTVSCRVPPVSYIHQLSTTVTTQEPRP